MQAFSQPNNIFRAVRMKDVNTFLSEMRSSSSEEVEVLEILITI